MKQCERFDMEVQLLDKIKEQLSKILEDLLKQSTATAAEDSELKLTTNRKKKTEKTTSLEGKRKKIVYGRKNAANK